MDQWLMPLTASIACREAGLPPEESLALTAAALVLNGPMAIAPTLVAIERYRSENQKPTKSGTEPTPTPDDPVVDRLVYVPKLDRKGREKAIALLHQHKLKAHVVFEPSTAGMKDKVIRQFPPYVDGGKLDPGTHVTIHIGAGPPDTKQAAPTDPAVATQAEQTSTATS